jgi:hypothetical protein
MQRIVIALGILAGIVPAAPAQEWGNIKGRVVWGPKELPVRRVLDEINKHPDKAHCLQNGELKDEKYIVDDKSRGLRWTFIWLINDNPKNKNPLPIHPKLEKIKDPMVEIDQPVCAFIPHALAIREGQILVAKNSSPVTHNIKWTGANNMGNVTVPAKGEFQIKELQAERLPMLIECNIHPWMNARCGVFNHPYFALTDKDGNFEIKDAPAGNYRVVIYNGSYLGGKEGRFGQQIAIPAGKTLDLGEQKFEPPADAK